MDVLRIFREHFRRGYSVYDRSFKFKSGIGYFLVKGEGGKKLVVAHDGSKKHGFEIERTFKKENLRFDICPTTPENAYKLSEIFESLKPKVCGKRASFGTGDRLGIATPGHAMAFEGSSLFPFFAQQSVRENERTGRDWKTVLSDAIWGVFQVGYEGDFGSDADHIKKEEDLISAIESGYTMFTIDPSDHVRNLSRLSESEKNAIFEDILKKHDYRRYIGKVYDFGGIKLEFDEKAIRDAAVVYSDALDHVERMYRILKERKTDFDFEVSVDETETPTSPLFHIFISEELIRRGVEFQNLALRFVGSWEKAVDYRGDLKVLENEMKIHAEIARFFGGYKLSLHSGSDKFSVYEIFSKSTEGLFHVKTAGTSYLVAIELIAKKDPKLYRKIHAYALEVFETDRRSYHVSTDLKKIPNVDELSDGELIKLFEMDDARQLIHITYGSTLRKFKDEIFNVLIENEEEYHLMLKDHIGKHIRLLEGVV